MKTLQVFFGLSFLLHSAQPVWAQAVRAPDQTVVAEICDNQLDDDGDGLVDCYDSDCQCFDGVDCSIEAVTTNFKTRLAWQSTENRTSVVSTPVVANLNPQEDNMPEIIVVQAGPNPFIPPNTILIFRGDGSNADNPIQLAILGAMDDYPPPSPTVADINKDGIPELIVACNDRKIRIYTNYTETAPMSLWLESPVWLDYTDIKPYVADFDQDGIPEIYAGSDIYTFDLTNPSNPQLLNPIQGPNFKGRAVYSDFQEGTCSPVAADLLSVADCNGDPDCAGLELAAGPVIYSIDLDPNDGDGYEIKIQRNLNLMAAGNNFADGYTSVADVDLDGTLDLIVASRRLNNQMGVYIWNKDQFIRFLPFPTNNFRSGSLPCIANVYDDKLDGFQTDLPEIIVSSAYNTTCFNLNIAPLVPTMPWWWNLVTEDFSGITGATTYDFNGDGLLEIVIRDEDYLRILYGGNQPYPPGVDLDRNWFTAVCGSITADEYPVVADVDNDGQTEIVVTGYTFSGYNTPTTNYMGRLKVYESDAEPWVPCRKIWNQFGYFIVNINDDLSVPQEQQLHHLELPAPGSDYRPLNRFLSQRPVLDENFQDFIPVPDASVVSAQAACNNDSLDVELLLCNHGSNILPTGTSVAFYTANPTLDTASLIGVAVTSIAVEVDSCRVAVLRIPQFTGTIYGIVNDNGTLTPPFQPQSAFPVTTQPECIWENNLFQFTFDLSSAPPLDLGPDISLCQDSVFTLNAGSGHAAYLWQDGSTDSLYTVQSAGLYWVEVNDFCFGKRTDSLVVEYLGLPSIQIDTVQGDCSGNMASATALASGSQPPYQFLWSNGNTSPQLSGVPDGLYYLTVTDAKGCAAYDSAWLQSGALLQASLNAGSIDCAGGTTLVSLSINTGTAPYMITWSNGVTGLVSQQLPAGMHAVTLTDDNGCSGIFSVTLQEPMPLTSNGISATASCPETPTGALSFAGAQQGVSPYSILWSNGATAPNIAGLTSGSYRLTITDANGCTLVDSATVDLHEAPALTTQLTHATCFGFQDGAILNTPSGGTTPFTYLWSEGQQTADLSDLTAGAYFLTVTDANGCTIAQTFEIFEPATLQVQATIQADTCASATGAINVTAGGGTPPYTYLWSNGETSPSITGLSAGSYGLTLMDTNGCTSDDAFLVTDAGIPPDVLAFTDTITCSQPLAVIGVTGNLAGFLFSWSGPAGPLPDMPTQTVGDAGNYQVTVTAPNGCNAVLQIELIEDIGFPVAEAGPNNAVLPCPPGDILLDAGGSSNGPGFENFWTQVVNGFVVAEMQGLTWIATSAGLYIHRVVDTSNGCENVDSVFVTQTQPILAEIDLDSVTCYGWRDGSIQIRVISGGTPPYRYSLDGFNFSVDNNYSGLPAGIYTPAVLDDQGCRWDSLVNLPEPEALSVQLIASDTVIELGQTLTLQAFPAPANAMLLDIIWEPANTFDFLPMSLWQWLQPEMNTEFSVRILDVNGCPAEDRVRISVDKYQVYAPNAILANDGVNAWFTLYTSDDIGTIRLLRIYDRWGSLVFENRDFAPGDPAAAWDGKVRGEPANPGVFLWYAEIELPDGRIRQLNGDVTVMR